MELALKLLDKFGPWAFLAVAAWMFWGHIKKQQEEMTQYLRERNKVDIEVARSTISLAEAVKIISDEAKRMHNARP